MVTIILTLLLPLAGRHQLLVWAEEDASDPAATAGIDSQDDANQDKEDETPAEEEAEEDTSAEESEEPEDESHTPREQDLPEGVRRRPRSGEQERQYKQRKTREDPFLNPPLSGGNTAADGYYNPADWLRPETFFGISRYIVQDESGEVIGHLFLALEPESDPVLGDFIKLKQVSDLGLASSTELWVYADTLKPRLKETITQLPGTGEPQPQATGPASVQGAESIPIQPLYKDSQRLDVEYLFDRMTIVHNAGGITARRQMRQLPFSYDIDQLPLLLRQLEVKHEEWPFEAVLCDPANETHIPVSIAQPSRVENIMTADVQLADCFEFIVRLGDEQRTYMVQRIPPYKLVKYTVGKLTYTLADYLEQQ